MYSEIINIAKVFLKHFPGSDTGRVARRIYIKGTEELPFYLIFAFTSESQVSCHLTILSDLGYVKEYSSEHCNTCSKAVDSVLTQVRRDEFALWSDLMQNMADKLMAVANELAFL